METSARTLEQQTCSGTGWSSKGASAVVVQCEHATYLGHCVGAELKSKGK